MTYVGKGIPNRDNDREKGREGKRIDIRVCVNIVPFFVWAARVVI